MVPAHNRHSRPRIYSVPVGFLALVGMLVIVGCAGRQTPEEEPATEEAPLSEEEEAVETETDSEEEPLSSIPTALPAEPEELSVDNPPTPVDPSVGGPANPARIEIRRIDLDALVQTVGTGQDGYITLPSRVAGYWNESAPLDGNDNTVIVGHNKTTPVEVFRQLPEVELGDEIIVTDQFGEEHLFEVVVTEVIEVEGVPADAPDPTLGYLSPTGQARLTLLTCYPAPNQCPDRFIVVGALVVE